MHTIPIVSPRYNTSANIHSSHAWSLICDHEVLHDKKASSMVLPSRFVPSLGYKYLLNGNIEELPRVQGGTSPHWTAYEPSGYTVDTYVYRSANTSVRVKNGAAMQQIFFADNDTKAGTVISVSGYSLATGDVSGSLGSDYSLYVDVKYKSGNNLFGQVAPFPGGSVKNIWVYSSVNITLTEPAKFLSLFLMYRYDANSVNRVVYFDDISLMVDGRG